MEHKAPSYYNNVICDIIKKCIFWRKITLVKYMTYCKSKCRVNLFFMCSAKNGNGLYLFPFLVPMVLSRKFFVSFFPFFRICSLTTFYNQILSNFASQDTYDFLLDKRLWSKYFKNLNLDMLTLFLCKKRLPTFWATPPPPPSLTQALVELDSFGKLSKMREGISITLNPENAVIPGKNGRQNWKFCQIFCSVWIFYTLYTIRVTR